MAAYVCAALLAGAVMYLVMALGFHFFPVKRHLRAMALVCLAHGAALPLLARAIEPLDVGRWLSDANQLRLWVCLSFFFLWFLYTQFFFIITKSITISILRHLVHAGPHGAKLEEIEKIYPMDAILLDRLDAMVHGGLLARREAGGSVVYEPLYRTRFYGRLFAYLKAFWRLSEGG